MPLTQFQWTWNGWTGGPGVTLFRCDGNLDSTQTDAAAAAQRTLLQAIRAYLPTPVSITCEPVVKVYAEGDGSLQDQRTIATLPLLVQGTGIGNWSAVSGCCVIWRTSQSMGRRLLMGRTFIVPLGNTGYANDGRLEPAFRAAINTALATYVTRVSTGTPGRPVVWHKPQNGGTNGLAAQVQSAAVGTKVAELVRRRD